MRVGRLLQSIAGFFALAAGVDPVLAADEVYVSNYYGGSIYVYPRAANGDVAPLRAIRTGLSLPHDLAIDLLHREIFAPNNQPAAGGPAINVYDLDAIYPKGDEPKRTITGPLTLLDRPAGLIVDPIHQEMYVANDVDLTAAILVFPLSANGNVAPSRVIQGALTTLRGPMGMALDLVHDELIVVSYKVADEGSITTFSRTANGNVAPLRTIQGPLTTFNKPQALALDLVHNELIVANSFFDNTASLGGLLVFLRTASGNVAPVRQITGANTGLCNPIGMTLDRMHDELFVTNAAGNPACAGPSVAVFARGASGNAPPLRKIGPGPVCDLNNPEGVAVLNPVDCSDPLVPAGTPCEDGIPCTSGDACGNGVCNTGTGNGSPGETRNIRAMDDKQTYTWGAQLNSLQYSAVRGNLGALPVGPGAVDEICFDDLDTPQIVDFDEPDSGTGFWYLTRGENACGAGTYGARADGTPRITTTCP